MKCSQSRTLRAIPGARGALHRYLPRCPPGSGLGRLPIMRRPGRPDRGWRSSTQRPSLPNPLSYLRMGARRKGIGRMVAGSIDAEAALQATSLRAAKARKKFRAITLPGKEFQGVLMIRQLSAIRDGNWRKLHHCRTCQRTALGILPCGTVQSQKRGQEPCPFTAPPSDSSQGEG